MDYTTSANVLSAMGANAPSANPLGATEQALIDSYVARVSRVIDRYITNAETGSDDYLKSETKTAEILRGQVDKDGSIVVFAHKPNVTNVASLEYRYSPRDDWKAVTSVGYVVTDGYRLTVYEGLSRGPIYVRITYTGGLASATASLPADIIEAATVLAIRYYKEARGGLEDVIGVADFGQPVYSKSMPARVREILAPYERPVPW